MKLTLKSLLSVLLAVMMLVTLVPAVMAEGEGDVVVLYTNDVHNAYVRADGVLGYPAVAQRKAELESEGKTVILVDCGDAIQGGVIGSLSKGKYIVSIMEDIGYDFAIPGNHEFDFGMDNFLEIADEAQYKYLSCNFTSLETGEPVLDAYSIVEAGGMKIAFVGVSTPETFTKSTPKYFQNEDGEYIYSFAEGNDGADLYAAVQTSVDAAIADGADKVILLAHLGTDESSKPWTSEDVAANTTGIDVILDGHSHSTIESEAVTNKNGEEVYISSTGTKLALLYAEPCIVNRVNMLISLHVYFIQRRDFQYLHYPSPYCIFLRYRETQSSTVSQNSRLLSKLLRHTLQICRTRTE